MDPFLRCCKFAAAAAAAALALLFCSARLADIAPDDSSVALLRSCDGVNTSPGMCDSGSRGGPPGGGLSKLTVSSVILDILFLSSHHGVNKYSINSGNNSRSTCAKAQKAPLGQ